MDENRNRIELNENEYEAVFTDITDLAQVRRNEDIYIICMKCGDAICSAPKDNVGCKCGNVSLDLDYCKIGSDDLSKCKVVRLKTK